MIKRALKRKIQELSRAKEEFRDNSHQISFLQATVGRMYHLSKEMLDCISPSKIYTMFLEEKWYEFQLSRLKE